MAARVLAFYTLCILLCSLHGVVSDYNTPDAEECASICQNRVPQIAAARCPAGNFVSTTTQKKHLTYYAHEIHSGPNATLLSAAGTGQGNMSNIGWGSFLVFDNAIKASDATDSVLLGSITGTLVLSTGPTSARAPVMTAQHLFTAGSEYNGSSLTLIGNILTTTPPYECIVAGGTGLLRGYSGYGILSAVPAATKEPLYVYQWDVHLTYKK